MLINVFGVDMDVGIYNDFIEVKTPLKLEAEARLGYNAMKRRTTE